MNLSHADRDYLREKLRKFGYSSLIPDELTRFHAYDYGFRAIFMDDRGHSPIDPDGRHHDRQLARQAELLFEGPGGFRTRATA